MVQMDHDRQPCTMQQENVKKHVAQDWKITIFDR
jgi:hypothetical protein